MKYVDDDSTIFWAVGRKHSVLAVRAEHCGKDVLMTIPLEGTANGEVLSYCYFLFLWYVYVFRKSSLAGNRHDIDRSVNGDFWRKMI